MGLDEDLITGVSLRDSIYPNSSEPCVCVF